MSTSTTTEEILDELTARSTTELVVAEATASTTIRYYHYLRYYHGMVWKNRVTATEIDKKNLSAYFQC